MGFYSGFKGLKVARVHSENVQSRDICHLLGVYCEKAEEIQDMSITFLLIDIKIS